VRVRFAASVDRLRRDPTIGASMMEDGAVDAGRPVNLELTYGEIVVLFELLHRWEDDGTLDRLPYVDDAERVAMWNLNTGLEPLVDEALSPAPEYDLAVETARASLRPK
jgi:hypothetical protein